MNESEQRQVVPIFEKDGNRIFICLESFVGKDETEAWEIGIGASLIEGVLWGMRPTHKTLDVTGGVPHRQATLYGAPIAIIGGPLFEETLSTAEGGGI